MSNLAGFLRREIFLKFPRAVIPRFLRASINAEIKHRDSMCVYRRSRLNHTQSVVCTWRKASRNVDRVVNSASLSFDIDLLLFLYPWLRTIISKFIFFICENSITEHSNVRRICFFFFFCLISDRRKQRMVRQRQVLSICCWSFNFVVDTCCC